MKMIIEIKNNGDLYVNGEFVAQLCYDSEMAGAAIAAFLKEMPAGIAEKPLAEVLDEETLECAYRIREHQYLLQDAAVHLKEWYDEDSEEYHSYADKDSEEYALELLVERFENARDCNRAENAVWDHVIHEFLEEEEKL